MIMITTSERRIHMTPKHLIHMLLLLCCALVAVPTSSFAFRFNPALQPFVPHQKDIRPRYPAPDFTLNDLDGTSVKLSDYQGSVVAIMFWTTW